MKRIGLTGGIASGKSTVARWIAARGIPILDADRLSRDLTRPGAPALTQIAALWPQVLRRDGTLDRAALGRIAFSDAGGRARLEAILIPAILDSFEAWAGDMARSHCQACVFDAALLFEQHLEARFDGVLLVAAPAHLQIERLMARDALSRQEAEARLSAQLPLDVKRRRARWILDNAGSLGALRACFEALWPQILGDSRAEG